MAAGTDLSLSSLLWCWQDIVAARENLEKYRNLDHTFDNSREFGLLEVRRAGFIFMSCCCSSDLPWRIVTAENYDCH